MRKKRQRNIYVLFLGIYFISLVLGAMSIAGLGSVLRYIGLIPVILGMAISVKKRQFFISSQVGLVCLFVIWVIISYCWSINSSTSGNEIFSYFAFIMLLLSVATNKFSPDDQIFLRRCLVWSSRITIIVMILFAQYQEGRMLLSGVINEDPNYLCGYFLFAAVEDIEYLFSSEEIKVFHKIVHALEFILIIYLIIATGSRGGMLCVLVSVFSMLIHQQYKKGLSIKRIGGLLLAGVFITVAYTVVVKYSSQDMLLRFSGNAIAESNGTGRYTIWADTIQAFSDSNILRKLFGYGTGTCRDVAQLFSFRIVNVTHNTYLQYLIEVGIIGLALFLIYMFCLFVSNHRKESFWPSAILIGICVLMCSTSLTTYKPYWNIVLYIVCCSGVRKTEVEEI